SGGPVLPAQRSADPYATASKEAGGYPHAGRTFRGESVPDRGDPLEVVAAGCSQLAARLFLAGKRAANGKRGGDGGGAEWRSSCPDARRFSGSAGCPRPENSTARSGNHLGARRRPRLRTDPRVDRAEHPGAGTPQDGRK